MLHNCTERIAEKLGTHGLCHSEMWLWWYETMFESWSIMCNYHLNLPKTLHMVDIISLMKFDLPEKLFLCTRQNLFNSLVFPMGFTLISQHPYNYKFYNWFWQNIHIDKGRILSLEFQKSLDTSSKIIFLAVKSPVSLKVKVMSS